MKQKGGRKTLSTKLLFAALVVLTLAFSGTILLERLYTEQLETQVLGVQSK